MAAQKRLPDALTSWAGIAARLAGQSLALFLDYDGTLVPIAERPELAISDAETRDLIDRVARKWPTAVITGRDLQTVCELLPVRGVHYAAAHGCDILLAGPDARAFQSQPHVPPLIAAAHRALLPLALAVPGVIIEEKTFALAVHYRLADPARVAEVRAAVDVVLASQPGLVRADGKKVFEIRPQNGWHKGDAVRWILSELKGEHLPIFIGDDTTDEDGFRAAVAAGGLAVCVHSEPRETAAQFTVSGVADVHAFLERVLAL